LIQRAKDEGKKYDELIIELMNAAKADNRIYEYPDDTLPENLVPMQLHESDMLQLKGFMRNTEEEIERIEADLCISCQINKVDLKKEYEDLLLATEYQENEFVKLCIAHVRKYRSMSADKLFDLNMQY
jgi:hypothetical protein